VKRRAFLALIGVASFWPLVALAEDPVPVVGFLNNATPEAYAPHSSHLIVALAVRYRLPAVYYNRLFGPMV
jgi:hypothetical protein